MLPLTTATSNMETSQTTLLSTNLENYNVSLVTYILRIPKHSVNCILLNYFSCGWGTIRSGVTSGNCLTSHAHIKEQLWPRKEKEPHPWLGGGGFFGFFS